MESSNPDDSSPGMGMRMVIFTINKKFSSVKQLSTSVLGKWMRCAPNSKAEESDCDVCKPEDECLDGKLIILDCRPEEEYVVSRIPGSVRVDFKSEVSKFIEEVPNLKETDGKMTVVCYCSLGYRSCVVAQKLDAYFSSQQGASSTTRSPMVYNLAGSIFKWANEGRSMLDLNNKTTIYAHPFSKIWSKVLDKNLHREQL